MESSVHFVAALRMLAKACGLGEATQVSARTAHVRPDLSDPDSLVGVIGFESGKGVPASVSISMAAPQVCRKVAMSSNLTFDPAATSVRSSTGLLRRWGLTALSKLRGEDGQAALAATH